jgi:hypothetical protein
MYKRKIISIPEGKTLTATLWSINARIVEEATKLEFSGYGKIAMARYVGYKDGALEYELTLVPEVEKRNMIPYWKVRWKDG